ncbi:MAG: diaminopimelate epimerase [Planctomycetota bacterium]|nr:diaminopimelate epimerase [Planctomycetota bacterium]
MDFVKMHGCGNDYVFVREEVDRPDEIARLISDRHRGVGGDGLILILPSKVADARMRMFNADGGEAEMCGNGLRCVAKLLYEEGGVKKPHMRVETGRGILEIDIRAENGRVLSARVGMGKPGLERSEIPMGGGKGKAISVPLEAGGETFEATCVSMGNPHCVLFVDDLESADVSRVGPLLEHHPIFPKRTNVGFAQVVSPSEIKLRVWERGSQETQACGTGACAAVVAAVLTGRTGRSAKVRLPGGDLQIEWPEAGDVYMEGPAQESFRGTWTP